MSPSSFPVVKAVAIVAWIAEDRYPNGSQSYGWCVLLRHRSSSLEAIVSQRTALAEGLIPPEGSLHPRKEYARWVAYAKREETRQRRVRQALEMIRAGQTRS